MKRAFMAVLFAATLASSPFGTRAAAAETPENSVNLGVGMSNFLPHCKATIYMLEFEHLFTPKVSGLVRASQVHYTFDDSEHVEDGRPRGVDLGARYYPAGGMKGFYAGGSVGYWRAEWTFTHFKGTSAEFDGTGISKSLRANLDIGWRFLIGSSVSITPSVNGGRYFSHKTCEYTAPASRVGTACTEESEVQNYAFIGVTAGFGF